MLGSKYLPLAVIGLFLLALVSLYLKQYLYGSFRLVAALGALLNTIAVVSNGWKMPVSSNYIYDDSHSFMNSVTKFPYLCDVLFGGVVSPGDVLITVGVFIPIVVFYIRRYKEQTARVTACDV